MVQFRDLFKGAGFVGILYTRILMIKVTVMTVLWRLGYLKCD